VLAIADTPGRWGETDVGAMGEWVVAAKRWGEASQGFAARATGLATASRDLADRIDARLERGPPPRPDSGLGLAGELRTLAAAIEKGASEQRDDYLQTAATLSSLDAFRS
jgi:hypothetical protein